MPRSITSSPARRFSYIRRLICANRYGGSRVTRSATSIVERLVLVDRFLGFLVVAHRLPARGDRKTPIFHDNAPEGGWEGTIPVCRPPPKSLESRFCTAQPKITGSPIMPRYNPAVIEPKWQKFWEENRTFACPRLPKGRKALRPGHVPLSQRRRPARRASRGLHGHRHRLPLQPDAGHERDAPDGLGRLRPARRAARQEDRHASAGDHREEHRQLPPAVEDARLQLRLGPRAGHDRRRLLPLDAVHLPGAVRHLVRRRRSSSGRPIAELPIPRGSRRRRRSGRRAAIRTSIAWPISSKPRSTGARRWAPCWPTRKSSAA